jgi:ABC-type sugar transport system substrate-binding protein
MASNRQDRPRRTALFSAIALATTLAIVLVLGTFGTQATAEERGGLAASANSGVFVGTNDQGQFQLALEDAVQQAATAAGCCDIRISYKVLETTGQQGGFIFLDDINVRILAEW